ncbi:MAG: hypothetical protein AAFX81_14715 [Pseudomonadota bacterium]
MVDVVTAGLVGYLGKDAIQRLLGPTADYLGGELENFVKNRHDNIDRIFRSAIRKSSDLDDDKVVSPRILKEVVNEGSYMNDEVGVEYVGGILASSRSDDAKNDHGLWFAQKVKTLSTYDLRLHYLFYRSLQAILTLNDDALLRRGARKGLWVFVDAGEIFRSFELTFDNGKNNWHLFTSSFRVLVNEDLLGSEIVYGNKDFIEKELLEKKNISATLPGSGLLTHPTITGVELYLWAFGKGLEPTSKFFESDFDTAIEGINDGFSNAVKFSNLTSGA